MELINIYIKPFALNPGDYNWAIKRVASINVSAGGIYDALHARAALTSKVDILLSLNTKQFIRLGSDISKLQRCLKNPVGDSTAPDDHPLWLLLPI